MGAPDSNGIWQYDLSDNESTAPGLLNKLAATVSTAIGLIKSRLTSLETSRDNPTVFVAASASARNSHWGTPSNATQRLALQNLGAKTERTDLGYTEQYFANTTDGGSNPGGVAVAGWYPVEGKMPYVEFRRSTNQSIGNSADATIDWDASPTVISGAIATESAGVITLALPGDYDIDVNMQFASNATGIRGVHVSRGGTTDRISAGVPQSAAVGDGAVLHDGIRCATAGEQIQVRVFQNSGGALNIAEYYSSGAKTPGLKIRYKGPR